MTSSITALPGGSDTKALRVIPKIIHQTWRDSSIPPEFEAMSRSWRDSNPGWTWRLWTDLDLERLVEEHYPHFLPIYRAYPRAIQRADAGRYLVLHRYGGVYADLDTDCLGPLDAIAAEDRIVLAEEPREHWTMHLPARGLSTLYFNGVMASPQGHPFWERVLEAMVLCRHARDVLDSTGPMLLTGCVLKHDPAAFALHSCHLFNAMTSRKTESRGEEFGAHAPLRLSRHHWAGTWWRTQAKRDRVRPLQHWRERLHAELRRGRRLNPGRRLAQVDTALLRAPLPEGADARSVNLAVLIPVRDVEPHLARCFELIERLDLPRERVKLVFCEGDSKDRSYALLEAYVARARTRFRDARLLKLDLGRNIEHRKRWLPESQRQRRSGIARVRNHLIRHGLDETDDWVLWVDADVCDYPPDIVQRLMAERAKIVVPNCVKSADGPSFDLNSYTETRPHGFPGYYGFLIDGLFQPPAKLYCRHHLHDLRYLDRVPLLAVGGTMILVHASVHRAGVDFPELPYRDLIETEAFGLLGREAGVTPVGLPNTLIFHSR